MKESLSLGLERQQGEYKKLSSIKTRLLLELETLEHNKDQTQEILGGIRELKNQLETTNKRLDELEAILGGEIDLPS
jgi:hypothetical protein